MSGRFLVWHQFLCTEKDLLIPTFCTFLVASLQLVSQRIYLFKGRKIFPILNFWKNTVQFGLLNHSTCISSDIL